jgi:hypothetical protein
VLVGVAAKQVESLRIGGTEGPVRGREPQKQLGSRQQADLAERHGARGDAPPYRDGWIEPQALPVTTSTARHRLPPFEPHRSRVLQPARPPDKVSKHGANTSLGAGRHPAAHAVGCRGSIHSPAYRVPVARYSSVRSSTEEDLICDRRAGVSNDVVL